MTRQAAITGKNIDGVRPRQQSSTAVTKRKSRLQIKPLLVITVLVIIAATGATTWIVYATHRSSSRGSSDITSVKASIAKHYLLPADEEPAIATVTNKDKLNTPFLKSAENGDRVLIYQKNRLAILYRPSLDRIVTVGPVTIDEPPAKLQAGQ